MPLGIPGITAGAGSSIPISAGGGTSGPANSGFTGAPINIGGLFAKGSQTAAVNQFPTLIIGALVLTAGLFFFLRR